MDFQMYFERLRRAVIKRGSLHLDEEDPCDSEPSQVSLASALRTHGRANRFPVELAVLVDEYTAVRCAQCEEAIAPDAPVQTCAVPNCLRVTCASCTSTREGIPLLVWCRTHPVCVFHGQQRATKCSNCLTLWERCRALGCEVNPPEDTSQCSEHKYHEWCPICRLALPQLRMIHGACTVCAALYAPSIGSRYLELRRIRHADNQ